MKKWLITGKTAPVVALAIILIIWEVAVLINNVPEWILPAPSKILLTTVNIFPLLALHTTATLVEALCGFLISIGLALLIGLVLNNVAWVKEAFYPLFILSQTIPLIVLAVLLPLWFGWGVFPKILIVVLVCFFPIVINLLKGLDSVDPDLVNLFRSMGAGRIQTFKIVKLPSAMPSFFAGLRISATYSIMAAVIAEWLGAQRGLGYFMTLQQKSFAIDQVMAAVLVICILSLILVKTVDLIEYIMIPWNRTVQLEKDKWNVNEIK